MTEESYRTQQEAIVAAIDQMVAGDKLTVHEEHCRIGDARMWWQWRRCTCEPLTWIFP